MRGTRMRTTCEHVVRMCRRSFGRANG